MIICEIGLNHLGSEVYANEYVEALLHSKVDGLTFQVREKSFYEKRSQDNLLLSEDFYKTISKKINDSGKKFGVAIADINMIKFFCDIRTDFYKVISNDILNFELI